MLTSCHSFIAIDEEVSRLRTKLVATFELKEWLRAMEAQVQKLEKEKAVAESSLENS